MNIAKPVGLYIVPLPKAERPKANPILPNVSEKQYWADRGMPEPPPRIRLLRLRDVIYRTGLSKSNIYRKINAGEFPRSVQIGEKAVAWREAEVEAWIMAVPRSTAP